MYCCFSFDKSSGSDSDSGQIRNTFETVEAKHSKDGNVSASEESAAAIESIPTLQYKPSKSISSSLQRSSSLAISTRENKSEGVRIRKEIPDKKQNEGKIIRKEEAKTGRVNSKIYAKYFAATGYVLFSAFVVLEVANSIFTVFNSFWLSSWSDDNGVKNSTNVKTQVANFPVAVRLRFYHFSISIANGY